MSCVEDPCVAQRTHTLRYVHYMCCPEDPYPEVCLLHVLSRGPVPKGTSPTCAAQKTRTLRYVSLVGSLEWWRFVVNEKVDKIDKQDLGSNCVTTRCLSDTGSRPL